MPAQDVFTGQTEKFPEEKIPETKKI